MKTVAAFITSALLATTALAAPEPEAWKNYRNTKPGKPACPGDKDKSPIPFTSTYNVVATPDQVVNTDNEFTGGLKVSVSARCEPAATSRLTDIE